MKKLRIHKPEDYIIGTDPKIIYPQLAHIYVNNGGVIKPICKWGYNRRANSFSFVSGKKYERVCKTCLSRSGKGLGGVEPRPITKEVFCERDNT